MKKIKLAVVGCGDRGKAYAAHALRNPEEAEIVAAIDINPFALKQMEELHHVPKDRQFTNLDDFLRAKIECDSVINATMDQMHYETAKKIILAGYNQLVEKPVVNNREQLLELRDLAKEKDVSLLVCHVLRYTPFYRTIKAILNSGEIGKISTIEMCEHVGVVHYASSYVRGNWRSEGECGSGFLLAKCCHDMDLLCWLNNQTKPDKVSSVAARGIFTSDNAPEGATKYCYNCPHKDTCLYDAETIHVDIPFGNTFARMNRPVEEISREEKLEFLKTDDFGRCVYKFGYDLVDRQNVSVLFENGSVGTLTVVAASSDPCREIRIVGTKGEIKGRLEDNKLSVHTFVHDKKLFTVNKREIDLSKEIVYGAHSGGDIKLMMDYVRYLNGDNSSISLTSINDSINGHLCVYAAEESRKTDRTIKIED